MLTRSESLILTNSMRPEGNIGFPDEQAGIDHFLGMIRQTARHISPDQLKTLGVAMLKLNQEAKLKANQDR